MRKKVLSVLLGVTMVVSMLSGCGSSASKSSAGGDTSSEGGSTSSKYKNTITVDVFDSLANYQGIASGWFADVVKKKFNMELNIIAPNVSGGGDTLYQTRSAAGNLGDLIIMGADGGKLQDCVTAGLITDMSKYMQNESNVNTYTKAIDHLNETSVKESGMWGIPTMVSTQSVTTPSEGLDLTFGPYLRWDLYAKLGYPQMNTLEDLLPVLQQMQQLEPTAPDGKKTYAFSLFKDWDGNMMCLAKQPTCFYGYDELGFTLAKADGSDYQSIIDSDSEYVRALKLYYEANKMGLVDPESTTQNYDTMYKKYQDGQILFAPWPWLGQAAYNTNANKADGKGFMLAPINDMKIFSFGAAANGDKTIFAIGSKAKDPQRLADFIDWLYSPEGVMLSCSQTAGTCGPEGLTWEIQDGKPVLTDFGKKVFNDGDGQMPQGWGNGTWKDGISPLNVTTVLAIDINPNTGFPYNYKLWDSVIADNTTPLDSDWQTKMGAKTTLEYLKNTDHMIVAPGSGYVAPQEESDIATMRSQCKEIIVQDSWKMVFAKDEDEFNTVLADMQKTVKGLGYEKVLAVDMKNAKDQNTAREKAVAEDNK